MSHKQAKKDLSLFLSLCFPLHTQQQNALLSTTRTQFSLAPNPIPFKVLATTSAHPYSSNPGMGVHSRPPPIFVSTSSYGTVASAMNVQGTASQLPLTTIHPPSFATHISPPCTPPTQLGPFQAHLLPPQIEDYRSSASSTSPHSHSHSHSAPTTTPSVRSSTSSTHSTRGSISPPSSVQVRAFTPSLICLLTD